MPFEIGSIIARFKAEAGNLKQNLQNIGNRVNDWARDLKKRVEAREKVKIVDEKSVQGQLSKITQRVKAFTQRISRTFKSIAIRIPTKLAIKALYGLELAAKKTARVIKNSLVRGLRGTMTGLSRLFMRLRRAMFGLQGLLASVGAAFTGFALIQRARDVDTLRQAFDNLTRSIGGTADSMIQKLRVALKGTVDDLEIMRITNNAVLLGVVDSEEQFAELATVARRLGRAAGRDTAQSLETLAVGIGRLSWRLLDNIGLIVKVGEANSKYAASLGRTVESLSDSERRHAFLVAAMEAGRRKIAEMGEDVDTMTDAWARFVAQIQNTITVIAQNVVGPGPFTAISDWLEENRKRIGSFAGYVARVSKRIISSLASAFEGLFSGNRRTQIAALVDFITDLLEVAITTLLLGIRVIFSKLGKAIIKLMVAMMGDLGNRLVAELASIFIDAFTFIQKQLLTFGKKAGLFFGMDASTFDALLLGLEVQAAKRSENIRMNAERDATLIRQFVDDSIDDVVKNLDVFGEELKKTFERVSATPSQNRFFNVMIEGVKAVREEFKLFQLELQDPFAGFKTMSTQLEIARLGDIFTKTIRLRESLVEGAPELITEKMVTESGERLSKFKRQIELVNEAFVKLKRINRGPEGLIAKENIGPIRNFVLAMDDLNEMINSNVKEVKKFAETIIDQKGAIDKADPSIQKLKKRLEGLNKAAEKSIDIGAALESAMAPRFFEPQALEQALVPFLQQRSTLRVDVELVGLEGADKSLQKFISTLKDTILTEDVKMRLKETNAGLDEIFETIVQAVDPTQRDNLRKLRVDLEAFLRQKENAEQMYAAAKALEKLDIELAKLKDQVLLGKGEISELAVRFRDLSNSFEEAIKKVPTEKIVEFRAKYMAMAEALAEEEVAKAARELEDLQNQIDIAAGKTTEEEVRIRQLTEGLKLFEEALRKSGISVERQTELFDEMRKKTIKLQEATGLQRFNERIRELEEQVKEARFEMDQIGRTDLQQKIAEIDYETKNWIDALNLSTEAIIAQKMAMGASEEEIEKYKEQVEKIKNSLLELASREKDIAVRAGSKERAVQDIKDLSDSLRVNFQNAIYEALVNGESFAKQWSKIFAGFFEDAMKKAFDHLQTLLTEKLSKIFENVGIGAAGGAIVQGLLGLAGAIYNALESKKQHTIEDFDEAINSAEAVRGVVAGPTNVAISAIGDSLKNALRTTEILLERIAIAVETGSYSGGGRGGTNINNNAVLPLTTSSV